LCGRACGGTIPAIIFQVPAGRALLKANKIGPAEDGRLRPRSWSMQSRSRSAPGVHGRCYGIDNVRAHHGPRLQRQRPLSCAVNRAKSVMRRFEPTSRRCQRQVGSPCRGVCRPDPTDTNIVETPGKPADALNRVGIRKRYELIKDVSTTCWRDDIWDASTAARDFSGTPDEQVARRQYRHQRAGHRRFG